MREAFFIAAGVTATILGAAAIGILVGVVISVMVFGNDIHLHKDEQ